MTYHLLGQLKLALRIIERNEATLSRYVLRGGVDSNVGFLLNNSLLASSIPCVATEPSCSLKKLNNLEKHHLLIN